MADLARFLRRFRRLAAPPGRASPAAVPADRVAERSEELRDLFAAIDRVEAEARRIRDESAEQCRSRRDEAEKEAGRMLDRARQEADTARAEEAARHRDEVEEEAAAALREAEEEADALRAHAGRRLDGMARRVVHSLLAPAGADVTDGGASF